MVWDPKVPGSTSQADNQTGALLVDPFADAVTLARLGANGLQQSRRYGGQSSIDYADSVELVGDWSTTTAATMSDGSAAPTTATNGVAVNANKLVGVAAAANSVSVFALPAYAPGTKMYGKTVVNLKTGGAVGSFAQVGFTTDATPAGAISANMANSWGAIIGGNVGAVQGGRGAGVNAITAAPTTVATNPSGLYEVSWYVDESIASITVRARGGAIAPWVWTIKLSTINGGNQIRNLFFTNSDARGNSSSEIWPFVNVIGSNQPTRSKTVAGMSLYSGADPLMTGIRSVRFTANTNMNYFELPPNYDPRRPAPVVMHFHAAGFGGNGAAYPWTGIAARILMRKTLTDAGFIFMSQDLGSGTADQYSNQASLDEAFDNYDYVRKHFATSQVVFLSESMGGGPSLMSLANRKFPHVVAAWAGICNLIDYRAALIDDVAGNPHTAMWTAYGATDNTDFLNKITGQNPMDLDPRLYRGTPMRFYTLQGDTVCVPSRQAIPFAAKVAPYVPEAVVVDKGAGAHLTTTAFDSADLLSFYQRYVAL